MESIDPLQKANSTSVPAAAKQVYISTTDLLKLTSFDSKQLGDVLRLISSQLGISAPAARKLLSMMATSGKVTSYADLKAFMLEQEPAAQRPAQRPETLKAQVSQTDEIANRNSANLYRAALRPKMQMSNDFAPQSTNNKEAKIPEKIPGERQILSELVTSPKTFASWLVNNKAAFVVLQTNPKLTYLLSSLANPNLQMSPLMLASLAALLAQLAKLKLGKSSTESIDDVELEERGQELLVDEADRSNSLVGGVRDAISSLPIAPLKDFLLEAERFAEEEIANRWSLSLKKDKAVEKKILAKFNKR